ncbi:alpha-L-fucosidase [Streptomyces sp. NPDC051940]|uniref:alpha-L-fucosidase n=1 Tax=Streptomyces sp. NPDC051940 TaxID=3155675 RepID=UPI0034491E62
MNSFTPSRRAVLTAALATAAGMALPLTAGAGRAAAVTPGGPALVPVLPGDTPEQRLAKAASVAPTGAQLAWQRRGVTLFTHYGVNTFTAREWGSGCEDPRWFAPTAVDTDQWAETYRASGATLALFTAKHHDGFVLYPTRYTNHSVIASPWWLREGTPEGPERQAAEAARDADPSAYWQAREAGPVNPRRDVLRQYVNSMRAAGLRVGVYLSPADGAELPHAWHVGYTEQIKAKAAAGQSLGAGEKSTLADAGRTPSGAGRYGNGSAPVARTIPTLVPGDDRADDVASGRLPSFTFTVDDYNAYYLNQLYELLTEYGKLDEIWLDNANPWSASGITQTYDRGAIHALIQALSPDTLIWTGPQGLRWVGNESGTARTTEWSVIPLSRDPQNGVGMVAGSSASADMGSRTVINSPYTRYLMWYPAECDVSIRPNWFWRADQQPKTAAQLTRLYEMSAGRNSLLLLNAPPATDGRIPDADVASLAGLGASLAATYDADGADLAAGASGAPGLNDGRADTAWSPDGGDVTGTAELALPEARTFDRIRLAERIEEGQRVEAFTVEAWDEGSGAWAAVASGTTIGFRRILALTAPVTTTRVRLRITGSRAVPRVRELGLFRYVPPAA